jgi:hypothetical protein
MLCCVLLLLLLLLMFVCNFVDTDYQCCLLYVKLLLL